MSEGPIELGNEFSQVVVERVRTRNGVRLRISVPPSGREILLCPLELEALTWAGPEVFSGLLATPHGPEDGAEHGPVIHGPVDHGPVDDGG